MGGPRYGLAGGLPWPWHCPRLQVPQGRLLITMVYAAVQTYLISSDVRGPWTKLPLEEMEEGCKQQAGLCTRCLLTFG